MRQLPHVTSGTRRRASASAPRGSHPRRLWEGSDRTADPVLGYGLLSLDEQIFTVSRELCKRRLIEIGQRNPKGNLTQRCRINRRVGYVHGLMLDLARVDANGVEVCRVCGAECAPHELRPVEAGGGCRTCNGSPACARCGHSRRHHRGAFGGGETGCTTRVTAELGLAVGRCGCGGYTTETGAFEESTPIVDIEELRLRQPGDPARHENPQLAPVRDLLDDGRRQRDLSEHRGVLWRPPS